MNQLLRKLRNHLLTHLMGEEMWSIFMTALENREELLQDDAPKPGSEDFNELNTIRQFFGEEPNSPHCS